MPKLARRTQISPDLLAADPGPQTGPWRGGLGERTAGKLPQCPPAPGYALYHHPAGSAARSEDGSGVQPSIRLSESSPGESDHCRGEAGHCCWGKGGSIRLLKAAQQAGHQLCTTVKMFKVCKPCHLVIRGTLRFKMSFKPKAKQGGSAARSKDGAG